MSRGAERGAPIPEIDAHAPRTLAAVARAGLRVSPQLVRGLPVTLLLALAATAGRIVVPVTVQRVLDRGVMARGGPDLAVVLWLAATAVLVLAAAGVAGYWANRRLFGATEAGLVALRRAAFDRVHRLSVLSLGQERRGALVSRVTSDVDSMSAFLQFGGLLLVTSTTQVTLATAVMFAYSWQLALLVLACYLPMALVVGPLQRRISARYDRVRRATATVLATVSETVGGADVIHAYGAEGRSARRIDESVSTLQRDAVDAARLTARVFSSGVLSSALALAVVVGVGTVRVAGGTLSLGTLAAFLFLVQLFTAPVQMVTELLNQLQEAVAGWRRVLAVVATPVSVPEPEDGRTVPPGAASLVLDGVSYRYPGSERGLRDVDLSVPPGTRVAVVGETGSGKTTLARLIARLVDPDRGEVRLAGVPLPEIAAAARHRAVVLVPQEGFLFDATVRENIRFGRPGADDAEVERVVAELGLDGWAAGLPAGLDTAVGEAGSALSAGERQLVALARTRLADPGLLILDEATSAVDPATETRLQHALDRLGRDRTTITIAHRMTSAERADLVVVIDRGRVVQTGRHADLVTVPGVYADLHRSWAAHVQGVGG